MCNVSEKIEVVGIRFKRVGKIYNFDAQGLELQQGMHVIVETTKGLEFGKVEKTNLFLHNEELNMPLKKVIRIATVEDGIQEDKNRIKELEALKICLNKIKKHKLDMKLIDVELTFDLSKIIFYFTSDGRVDFRALVKDLASIFRMRIELRQIGVRDESKIKNGIGICGRTLCCATFLDEFQPVSIRMAKEQNLSLNPAKISGACGRLMCCLKYEEDTYEYLNKGLPSEGDIVLTPDGNGIVMNVNVLQQLIKAAVRIKPDEEPTIGFYNVSEIKIIVQGSKKEDDKIDDELIKILD